MNHLHHLLHSLSAHEVAYLNKSAQTSEKGRPKYLNVMEAIRKQPKYDEVALLKQFRREKFVKQFSVMKHYLHHSIMNGLAARHIADSEEFRLTRQITQIKILLNKGLYELAEDILQPALEESRTAEAFIEWLDLLALQRYLIVNHFLTHQKISLKQNTEETEQVMLLYSNFLKYQEINSEQSRMSDRSFHIRNEDYLKEHEMIMKHPLIADETKALTQRALFELFMTRLLYYNITDQREAFFQCANQAFQQAHACIWLIKFDKLRLLSVYPQLMHAAYLNGKWQVLEETLELLKKFTPGSQIQEMAAFTYHISFSLVLLQATGRQTELMKTITNAYGKVKHFGNKLRFDARSQIIISCMSGTLESGHYEQAIDWALLFNEFDQGERLDARLIVDMMELIAHNELGQLLLVSNLSQAIYQRALRWGEKGKFEDTFIRFFKKITSIVEPDELSRLYRKTLDDLKEILEGDIVSQNRTIFPIFETYVQSRIQGVSYHQYLIQSQSQSH
ncbi:MAG: hypothetical protein U0T74_10650 [Chitinophagales bacterium]